MKFLVLFFLLLPSVAFSQVTQSVSNEKLPLLELGGGVVSVDVPDYPGSSHNTTHTIPFPAGILRGDILRADEEGGARARFFKNEMVEINMSIGGSLPSDSKDSPDREGMPDLETMLEFGPGFIFHIIRPSPTSKIKLSLNLPVRFAFTTDLKNWDDRGFVVNPLLFYIHEGLLGKNTIFFSSLDSRFATERMMDYFYAVAPQHKKTDRPVYQAKAGYMGSGASIGLSYNFKNKVSLFGGVLHSYYGGAINEKSPLLVKKNNTHVAVGLVWWFWKSRETGYK